MREHVSTSRGPLNVAVVATGNELLLGGHRHPKTGVVDENSPMAAAELTEHGARVIHMAVTPDDLTGLVTEFRHCLAIGAKVLVVMGGLGSTEDDLTNEAIGEVTGRRRVLVPWLRDLVITRERMRWDAGDDEAMRLAADKQASLPAGAVPLRPPGTAAPYFLEADDGTLWLVVPGPPWEASACLRQLLADPRVEALLASAERVTRRTVRIFGGDENTVNAALRQARALGYLDRLPPPITCFAEGGAETRFDMLVGSGQEEDYASFVAFLRQRFPNELFSEGPTLDEMLLPALANRVVAIYGTNPAAAQLYKRLWGKAGVTVDVRVFMNDGEARRFAGAAPGSSGAQLALRIAERGLSHDGPDLAVAIVADQVPAHACVASSGAPPLSEELVSPQERQGGTLPEYEKARTEFLAYRVLRLLLHAAQ